MLDSCKKTSVVLDSVVSSVEFVNCQSVQMQVLTKVPTISIDKTDGCQIYLNAGSLDVSIVSAKSSEMNVLVPKDGDYVICDQPFALKVFPQSHDFLFFVFPGGIPDPRTIQNDLQWQGFDDRRERNRLKWGGRNPNNAQNRGTITNRKK